MIVDPLVLVVLTVAFGVFWFIFGALVGRADLRKDHVLGREGHTVCPKCSRCGWCAGSGYKDYDEKPPRRRKP